MISPDEVHKFLCTVIDTSLLKVVNCTCINGKQIYLSIHLCKIYLWRLKLFSYQVVSVVISAGKVNILTWTSIEIDSLLQPDPSSQ